MRFANALSSREAHTLARDRFRRGLRVARVRQPDHAAQRVMHVLQHLLIPGGLVAQVGPVDEDERLAVGCTVFRDSSPSFSLCWVVGQLIEVPPARQLRIRDFAPSVADLVEASRGTTLLSVGVHPFRSQQTL